MPACLRELTVSFAELVFVWIWCYIQLSRHYWNCHFERYASNTHSEAIQFKNIDWTRSVLMHEVYDRTKRCKENIISIFFLLRTWYQLSISMFTSREDLFVFICSWFDYLRLVITHIIFIILIDVLEVVIFLA